MDTSITLNQNLIDFITIKKISKNITVRLSDRKIIPSQGSTVNMHPSTLTRKTCDFVGSILIGPSRQNPIDFFF